MRLIDADALQFVPKGTKYVVGVRGNGKSLLNLMAAVQEAIDKTPTIDAVPVVRCKECKNRQDPRECPFCFTEVVDVDGGRLYKFTDLTHDDGFCNRGERRSDNE